MRKSIIFICLAGLVLFNLSGQDISNKDKGVFKEYKKGYFQNVILKGIEDFEENVKESNKKTYFTVDFKGNDFPTSYDLYTNIWHQPPVSQGRTGTCWCFATTSFLESEIKRLSGQTIKLSEMYTVYWEYIERAKAYVKERGDVYFAEGSEATSVPRIMKLYGAVPESEYTGMLNGQQYHDHTELFDEMESYLESVRVANNWNEAMVISTIKNILNKYLGEPPTKIEIKGKIYTPEQYLNEVLKLNPDDYYSFMSTLRLPYNQKGELIEPDNWWHCEDYYNVSVDDFIEVINQSIENEHTVCICGDVSEPGYDRYTEVAVIPSFDIPSEHINEYSRQYRLENKVTTDDHCIHIVGYYKEKGDYWYLIKDSGSGGFDGPTKGYRYLHEDYVKLKMMNIMVHKYAAKKILNKIIK